MSMSSRTGEKLTNIAFAAFCIYVSYLAWTEYYTIEFAHQPPAHPFGIIEKHLDKDVAKELASVSYTEQLLWVGGVSTGITLLMIAAWFVRKLFYLGITCGALFFLYIMYLKYLA